MWWFFVGKSRGMNSKMFCLSEKGWNKNPDSGWRTWLFFGAHLFTMILGSRSLIPVGYGSQEPKEQRLQELQGSTTGVLPGKLRSLRTFRTFRSFERVKRWLKTCVSFLKTGFWPPFFGAEWNSSFSAYIFPMTSPGLFRWGSVDKKYVGKWKRNRLVSGCLPGGLFTSEVHDYSTSPIDNIS